MYSFYVLYDILHYCKLLFALCIQISCQYWWIINVTKAVKTRLRIMFGAENGSSEVFFLCLEVRRQCTTFPCLIMCIVLEELPQCFVSRAQWWGKFWGDRNILSINAVLTSKLHVTCSLYRVRLSYINGKYCVIPKMKQGTNCFWSTSNQKFLSPASTVWCILAPRHVLGLRVEERVCRCGG
jgi:hypothetical protein